MITVDARGDACPIPVVRTKNAVKALGGPGKVKTLVDNEIAVQNLTKMADRKGWKASSKKTGEDTYEVLLSVGTAPQEPSDTVGSGNDELGHVLMKSFVYALTQQDVLPETMIFYNTGAKLTCEGSPVLEDLQTLAAMGVEIVTCGTCLDFQHLKEKLQIGTVTNMYDIAERLLKADHIIRP